MRLVVDGLLVHQLDNCLYLCLADICCSGQQWPDRLQDREYVLFPQLPDLAAPVAYRNTVLLDIHVCEPCRDHESVQRPHNRRVHVPRGHGHAHMLKYLSRLWACILDCDIRLYTLVVTAWFEDTEGFLHSLLPLFKCESTCEIALIGDIECVVGLGDTL